MERSRPADRLLRYGDLEIPYRVLTKPNRRGRIAISVHYDGKVDVEAPDGATSAEIGKAVQKRARWIVGHVQEARKRFEYVRPRRYVSGEQVLYLGRRYSLKVRKVAKSERFVKLQGGLLVVATEDISRSAVRARLRAWYRLRARDYFAARIAAVSEALPWQQDPPPFRLLSMSKHWGSCAKGGQVTLNPFLVKAPRDGIDYVIAHELCHLREHNHSRRFFRLLDRAMPGWEDVKARLDGMAEVMLND